MESFILFLILLSLAYLCFIFGRINKKLLIMLKETRECKVQLSLLEIRFESHCEYENESCLHLEQFYVELYEHIDKRLKNIEAQRK
jgi:hypothetical protein